MRRSARRSYLPVIAALTASGALLTAGCGGDDDDDSDKTAAPAAWIDAVCTGVDGYVKAGVAAQNPAARTNNDVAKTTYATFIDAVLVSYSTAEQTITDIGKPDVPKGDQRQTEALRLFRGAQVALEAQRGQLEGLDPKAPDFQVRFAEVGQPLPEQSQLLGSIFSDPDLREPVANSQTCQAIKQSLGTP